MPHRATDDCPKAPLGSQHRRTPLKAPPHQHHPGLLAQSPRCTTPTYYTVPTGDPWTADGPPSSVDDLHTAQSAAAAADESSEEHHWPTGHLSRPSRTYGYASIPSKAPPPSATWYGQSTQAAAHRPLTLGTHLHGNPRLHHRSQLYTAWRPSLLNPHRQRFYANHRRTVARKGAPDSTANNMPKGNELARSYCHPYCLGNAYGWNIPNMPRDSQSLQKSNLHWAQQGAVLTFFRDRGQGLPSRTCWSTQAPDWHQPSAPRVSKAPPPTLPPTPRDVPTPKEFTIHTPPPPPPPPPLLTFTPKTAGTPIS